MKKLFLFACLLMAGEGYAQQHPCFLTDAQGKTETQRLVREEEWAKEVFGQLKRRTDQYADKGAEWLTSRLQMYWKSRATEVYIKGGCVKTGTSSFHIRYSSAVCLCSHFPHRRF